MNLGVVDELMVHLTRPDRRRAAERCVELIESGTSLAALVDQVLAPAMERVGSLWETSAWTVTDEHLATAAAEAALSAAAAECHPPRRRGEAVVACVEGDWHSLPSRMLAEVLVSEGWEVRFLGASQPTRLMVEHLARFRPDVVLLSCAVPMALADLAVAVQLIHQLGLPVLAGGRALGRDGGRARRLGADGWAPDASGAVRLLEEVALRDDVEPLNDGLAVYRERQRLLGGWSLAAMDRLAELMPEVCAYPAELVERTRRDLEHVLDMAALSLLLQDPGLLDEQCRWLQGVLDARNVPSSALALGVRALVDTTPDHVLTTGPTQALEAVTPGLRPGH